MLTLNQPTAPRAARRRTAREARRARRPYLPATRAELETLVRFLRDHLELDGPPAPEDAWSLAASRSAFLEVIQAIGHAPMAVDRPGMKDLIVLPLEADPGLKARLLARELSRVYLCDLHGRRPRNPQERAIEDLEGELFAVLFVGVGP